MNFLQRFTYKFRLSLSSFLMRSAEHRPIQRRLFYFGRLTIQLGIEDTIAAFTSIVDQIGADYRLDLLT